MTVTNSQSGTNVHEVSDGIYRINTPVVFENGNTFSFNQYLITDDEPLLFHTGPRKMFPLVCEAVTSILPVERLRYIGFSHVEADECGSLDEWLVVAPHPCLSVKRLRLWSQLRILQIGAPAHSPIENCSLWAGTLYVSPMRRICRMHWECGFLTEEHTSTKYRPTGWLYYRILSLLMSHCDR